MKILYLYPNKIKKRNWGYQLFRNEIARQHDVTFYGKHYTTFDPLCTNVVNILERFKTKPDIIMTFGNDSRNLYRKIGNVTDILKVHFLGDYNDVINTQSKAYSNNIERQNVYLKNSKFDVIFTLSYRALELLRKNKMCDITECLPFSVDTNVYKDFNLKKINDVMAVYSTKNQKANVYPNRERIHQILKKMKISTKMDYVVHEEMIKWINQSKININSLNYYRSLNARFTETLACGTLLMTDKPDDLEKLGFVDGEHLVIYKNLKDLKEKILYYLKHEEERERIAQQGEDFVIKHHSCQVRVKEMMNFIKEKTGVS
jgi:hypothetical protein